MEAFGGLSGFEQGDFVYLIAILLIVAVFSLPLRRLGLARMLGYALAWSAIIGVLYIAAEGSPSVRRYIAQLSSTAPEPRDDSPPGQEVRVDPAIDGHYWVRGRVNGHVVRFLVDTGASDVVLSQETAARVGIDVTGLVYDRPGVSASGRVDAAEARVSRISVGGIARSDMTVSVIPGADINLLGMSFLRTLDSWRVEKGELVMRS